MLSGVASCWGWSWVSSYDEGFLVVVVGWGGCVVGMVGWLGGWLVGWLVDWVVGWLVG